MGKRELDGRLPLFFATNGEGIVEVPVSKKEVFTMADPGKPAHRVKM